ncbi:ABC transporter ATP-binding protein [SAR202 cluster bacterium AD-804-J14_MRT_500m]|nr:ABC transporter ATP-binding protein [SAR202 cluster bacterium AD-804-J14_MRT_500m]
MHGGWRVTREDAIDDRRGRLTDHKLLARLFAYALRYKPTLLVSLVTMGLYTATVVAAPLIILKAVDQAIEERSVSGLTFWAIIFFVTAAINYLTHYVHQVTMARVSQDLLVSLRGDLFNHLQNLSMSFYDKVEMGRIMSRIQNDVHQIQEFLSQLAITLGDLLTIGVIVAVMIFIDWKLAIITLSVVPLLVIMAGYWQIYSWPRFMRVRRALAIVNGNLQENISGMRVIQSLNREDENLHQFDELNRNHLKATLSGSRFSSALLPGVEVLTGIAMGLVIIFGGLMVLNGDLMVGVVVAFALYIQRFFEPIRNLTMQYTMVQRAMTSAAHIFELMDVKPEVAQIPDAPVMPVLKGELAFENVSFHYTPGVDVLRGIDLQIKQGETVAVVGATGAGKTTLSSLILRLYDVTGGRITVDGQDIRQIDRSSLVAQIGTVIQEPFLFSGSIKDNIRFSHSQVTDEQIVNAAKVVGVDSFIRRMDGGYDAPVDERGGNLSAGQRQLIALARALVFDPKIIILDEATASVDSYTEMIMQKSLGDVLRDRTALIIAHRLSTVRSADRIIVMDQGRIVEEGNHSELLDLQGVYSKLYRMSFENTGALNGCKIDDQSRT